MCLIHGVRPAWCKRRNKWRRCAWNTRCPAVSGGEHKDKHQPAVECSQGGSQKPLSNWKPGATSWRKPRQEKYFNIAHKNLGWTPIPKYEAKKTANEGPKREGASSEKERAVIATAIQPATRPSRPSMKLTKFMTAVTDISKRKNRSKGTCKGVNKTRNIAVTS